MILTRTAAPAALPVTLDQAKAQCRVDSDHEDDLISDLIDTAADLLDGPSGILGRAIITQTWAAQLTGWPSFFVLPVEPVSALEVTYLDALGAEQTLDAELYRLVSPLDAAPYLQWVSGAVLPSLSSGDYPVSVVMTAGFGAADAVPKTIKTAMLMLVQHWYDNREIIAPGSEMPMSVSGLLARYRRFL